MQTERKHRIGQLVGIMGISCLLGSASYGQSALMPKGILAPSEVKVRSLVLPLSAPVLSSTPQAGKQISASAIRICTPSRPIPAHQQPVYVVDGTVTTDSAMRKLPVDRIASLRIERPKAASERAQATRLYGPNASNGLIFVTLK
ncbi:hypothetical protein [Fibrella aestuarina]|uniref:hypothetical protein n=1 Tax=Fibrella aestuarina TaxID=651143 RepID=UPI00059C7A6E|nr:hypothetical protein [Fibrella aestuarina]